MRERRVSRLRRRWPVVLLVVVAAFALGFYLLSLVFAALSSFVIVLAPESGGLQVEIPSILRLGLGGLLGVGAAFGLVRPSPAERSWRKGSAGERRVGRMLDRQARSGVVVLHDLKIPGSAANIDHVVVTPAGVFTIETKAYKGRLETRGRGSQLWINGRNRTSFVDQANRQAEVVRGMLARSGVAAPTYPMLCFVDTELPLLFPPRQIGGVIVCKPNGLSKHLHRRSATRLSRDQVRSVAEALAARLN